MRLSARLGNWKTGTSRRWSLDRSATLSDRWLLKRCALPLTEQVVVNRIITNLSMLDMVEGGLKRVKLSDGVTEAELRAATESTL